MAGATIHKEAPDKKAMSNQRSVWPRWSSTLAPATKNVPQHNQMLSQATKSHHLITWLAALPLPLLLILLLRLQLLRLLLLQVLWFYWYCYLWFFCLGQKLVGGLATRLPLINSKVHMQASYDRHAHVQWWNDFLWSLVTWPGRSWPVLPTWTRTCYSAKGQRCATR